jgi:branched-subunit amino acid transport protein
VTAGVWITVAGLCAATALIKAVGPLMFGGHELHPTLNRVIALMAPTLLAALVVTETFGLGRSLVVDARAGGLAVAATAIALRAPLTIVVVCAAAVTATLRALG